MSLGNEHTFMECVENNSSTGSLSFPVPNVPLNGNPNGNNDIFNETFQIPHSSSNDRTTSLAQSLGDDFATHSEATLDQRLNESNEADVNDRTENQPLETDQNQSANVLRFNNNTIPRLERHVGRGRAVPLRLFQQSRVLEPEPLELIQARRILVNIRQRFRYMQQINRLIEPDSLPNLHRKKSKYTKKSSQKTSFHKYMLYMQNACTSNTFQNKEKVHPRLIKKRQSHR